MNRLERECLAGSLVMHTLLLVLVVVGAGFASREKPQETVQLLNFIPDVLVDAPIMGGGTPQTEPATQPPALPPTQPAPPPPQPRVEPPPPDPEPPRKPEPRKPVQEPAPKKQPAPKAREPEPAPEPDKSPDGELPPSKRKIEPNLKPVTRSPDQGKAERERAAKAEAARAQAQAQRLADIRQQRVNRAVTGLQQNLSSTTSVSVPGTGGATYASYKSYVDLVYRSAWAPLKPREVNDRTASVLVRVVIARDGKVLSRSVRKTSGDAALDRSVQAAINRVDTIGRPFPEGSRDAQREFDIVFTLESTGSAG